MSVDTKKKTQSDNLIRIFALRSKQTIPQSGTGVHSFNVGHNLGYIPAFKVFYRASDKTNPAWLSFPNTYETSSAQITAYDPFLVSFGVNDTNFVFNCVNEDSVSHDLDLLFLIYADKAAGEG